MAYIQEERDLFWDSNDRLFSFTHGLVLHNNGRTYYITTHTGEILSHADWETMRGRIDALYRSMSADDLDEINARIRHGIANATPPERLRSESAPRGGYVYLVKDKAGNYKIGITASDPDMRIRQLSNYGKTGIEVVSVFYSDNPRQTEASLHKRFANKCIHGEWFQLDEDDLDHIATLAAEWKVTY